MAAQESWMEREDRRWRENLALVAALREWREHYKELLHDKYLKAALAAWGVVDPTFKRIFELDGWAYYCSFNGSYLNIKIRHFTALGSPEIEITLKQEASK